MIRVLISCAIILMAMMTTGVKAEKNEMATHPIYHEMAAAINNAAAVAFCKNKYQNDKTLIENMSRVSRTSAKSISEFNTKMLKAGYKKQLVPLNKTFIDIFHYVFKKKVAYVSVGEVKIEVDLGSEKNKSACNMFASLLEKSMKSKCFERFFRFIQIKMGDDL